MSLSFESRLKSHVELISRLQIPESFLAEGTADLDDETLCDAAVTLYALIEESRKLLSEESR